MKPPQPVLPGASKAIKSIFASPYLSTALCLAGALVAFLVYPAYAQSSDEASAPSNLTAAIADGGVILNWSSGTGRRFRHGLRGPAAASEGGRGRPAGPGRGHRFHGHHLRRRHGKRAGDPLRLPGQGASWQREELLVQLRPRRPARGSR